MPQHVFTLLWLGFGAGIIAVQNHQPIRYYVPSMPAMGIAAAWAIEELLLTSPRPRIRTMGWIAASVVVASGVAILGTYYLVLGHTNAAGRDVTAWLNSNVPAEAGVMGIATYGVGAAARYYPQEYFAPSTFLSDSTIRTLGIHYVVYDDNSWRYWAAMRRSGFDGQLARRFSPIVRLEDVGIWKLRSPAPAAPSPAP